jgi:hypothetical protein
MKTKLLTSIIALSLYLTGCSSSPTASDLAEEQAKAEKARYKAELEMKGLRSDEIEKQLKEYPEWSMNPPRADATGVYGVGVGIHQDIRIAMKKAQLYAEFEVATQMKQLLSGSERDYTSTSKSGGANSKYTLLIDKLVAEAPVVGYDTVKRYVAPIDGTTHAFVLIKMPYAQYNKSLQELQADDLDKESNSAFDELQERLLKLSENDKTSKSE